MKETPPEAVCLLVVSRELSVLRSLWAIGEFNCWHLEAAESGWEALERLQSGLAPDLLLLDLPCDHGESLHVLRWVRRLCPELPIVLFFHPDEMAWEKEALCLGAQDVLMSPVEKNQLESVIRKHLSRCRETRGGFTSEAIEQLSEDTYFIDALPVTQKLRAQAELLAQADVPVLIMGESGSGRYTAARLVHQLSVRSGFKLLKVNCAALPAALLEQQLFGHSEVDNRWNQGKLELCHRGTIFFDDVAEMPINIQEKLLHVIEEKQLSRPGTDSRVEVDVRVLAATDINVERALLEKKLREDLYYRLSAFTVHIPPLRQRKDEIPFLLQYFMKKYAKHYGLPEREFSKSLLDRCQQYCWPGNMRELESFVKRYLMIGDEQLSSAGSDQSESTENMLSTPIPYIDMKRRSTDEFDNAVSEVTSLKSLIHNVKCEAERTAIEAALEKTGWNRKAAARLLQVSYRTMLYKIEQYHMRLPKPTAQHPRQTSAHNV